MKYFFLAALFMASISSACLFGGGDNTISVSRPSSIPTATPPATPPEPILLGEAQASASPVTAGGGDSTYTVKSGDTLDRIADQLGIDSSQKAGWTAEVLRLNGIQDARLLQAGMELRLPKVQPTPRPTGTVTTRAGTPTSTATRAAATTPTTAATPAGATATPRPTVLAGPGTYVVQPGDNPSLIGQKLGVPETQLAAWANELISLNGIDPLNLQVGQVLKLPPSTPSGGGTAATPTATRVP